MLLIISDYKDVSTDYVCEYLNLYKVAFFRWNTEEYYNIDKIVISNEKTEICLEINKNNLAHFNQLWLKRGKIRNEPIYNIINNLKIKQKKIIYFKIYQ
jgi:hypothetical protein